MFARWQYVRSPGEPWARRFLQPQNVGTPTPELRIVGRRGGSLAAPAYANDLGIRRRILDALVADVVPWEREEHRGSPVWHYRVSVDGERAASELPEPVHREMRRWEEGKGRRDLDVWLDGRERLRKLSVFYPDEQGRGFRVENEFWDFGGPGRIDLPTDLGDPTAVGGEGVTSYAASPDVKLDPESPGFTMSAFSPDRPDEDVTLHVDDQPDLGGDGRRRFFRIRPASGRPLEPGEHRLVNRGEFNRGVPLTVEFTTPEVETRCPPDRPRSGNLTVIEAVQYEGRYYVRLHVRFTVSCRSPIDGAPVTVTGEARYYSLT